MWRIEKRPQFAKQFKNLGSVRQQLVDTALRDLALSEDPAKKGEYKPSLRIWAYELNKSDRILYAVDYSQNVIILLRVCDHKSVYGKD